MIKDSEVKDEIKDEIKDINIINGDCINELKKINDNSIDCVITDTPYFI